MGSYLEYEREARPTPRIVVIGLASCFGCQLQITNDEPHLLDVLGQVEVGYWQLASSEPMPEDFDVAIIEGAVTTEEAVETVRSLRERAKTVIAIGACSNTGGIPGMAAHGFKKRPNEVYGDDGAPEACGRLIKPRAVHEVVDVDFCVLSCPIDFHDFVQVLEKALHGSNRAVPKQTMCGDCKRNETCCFYEKGEMCLGMVTTAGCGARCVRLGRPCNGCRGLSPDANLLSARRIVAQSGLSVDTFDKALEMFNQTNPQYKEYRAALKEA